jgi:hypothetical protein
LDRFGVIVENLERRWGRQLAALLVSLTSLAAAALYVRPAVKPVALGVLYGRMAEDPFTFIKGNYVAFRILTPLVSWCLGLRGQAIIITNLLAALTLLILVYLYFRREADHHREAVFAVLVLAFSLVTLTTVYYGGYTDSLTYVIVFLMWRYRSQPAVFYPLLLAGLLNRESIVFLLPWFWFLQYTETEQGSRFFPGRLIGLVVVIALFFLYRRWIGSQGEVPFRAMYYLEPMLTDPLHWFKRSYPESWLGFFSVFKLLWVFPVLWIVSLWRDRSWRPLWAIAILAFCTGAQLLVAYDSSRMLTLGFMVMIVSLKGLFAEDRYAIKKWGLPLLIGNLLVPQLYTAAHIVEFMHSVPARLFQTFVLNDPVW